jgi:hypothetical protein
VWDDWLNREDGKEIRRPSTASRYGIGGELLREYPTDRLEVTLPVVCDPCNNRWMSDLSNHARTLLEPSTRRDQPLMLDEQGVLTITAFAFLKSAVLDWMATDNGRQPVISRAACTAFRDSLADPSYVGDVALPVGLQVWIARYRRTRTMEALAFTEEMTGARHFKGYRILVITYVVGSFIFQLTLPRWVKVARKRTTAPFFQVFGDIVSVPIWPGITTAHWPPPTYSGQYAGGLSRAFQASTDH